MEKQLEALREMVIKAAGKTTDVDLLDLVWRLLVQSEKEGA